MIWVLGQRQIELIHRLAAEGRVAVSRYVGNRSAPLIGKSLVANPEWGPATPSQVVYLPSEPSTAMMRDDLDAEPLSFQLAGGLFAFVGAAFVLASLLLLRPSRGLRP